MRDAIPAALAGERLDRLVAMLGDLSRAEAAALVASGAVAVDGRIVTSGSHRVREGAIVEADVPLVVEAEKPHAEPAIDVTVVYADGDVIVVDKEPGLVVHPGAANPDGTLVNALLARYPELSDIGGQERPGIVHRLDKGTSGLLVVARSALAYDELVRQLASHSVLRQYVALVWEHLDAPAGVIDAPIGRNDRDPTKMAVVAAGKPARTRYELRQAFSQPVPTSLVSCQLETGRTHQIRVHLAAIGHAVVGDARYGGARAALLAPRPMLHAGTLAFDHPRTGEPVTFTAPVPPDMAEVLAGLE